MDLIKYGCELANKMAKHYNIVIEHTPSDFKECEDKIDVQCVVDSLCYEAREKRYKSADNYPKVKKFVISTSTEEIYWTCRIGERNYFGVFQGDNSFSPTEVKHISECIHTGFHNMHREAWYDAMLKYGYEEKFAKEWTGYAKIC